MAKRIADKNLTDKNRNQEDEGEEAGPYPIASEVVLKSCAIKKAIRRNAGGEGESPRGFKGLEGIPATSTTSAPSGAAAPAFFGFGNGTTAYSGLSSLFSHTVTANATPVLTLNDPTSSKPTADTTSKQTDGSTPSLMLSSNSSSSISSSSSTNSNIFNINDIISSSTSSSTKNYSRDLASLNCSVRDWITKHVDDNPLLDLSPVFRDYEQHLANIEKKYCGAAEEATGTAGSATALEGLTDSQVSGEKQWGALLPTTSAATSLSSSSSGSTQSFSFDKDKDDSSPEKSSVAPPGPAVIKHNFGQKVDASALATPGSATTHLPTTITPTSLPFSSSSSTLLTFNKNTDTFSSSTIPFSFDRDKYFSSSPFGQAPRFGSPQASSTESLAPFSSSWAGGEEAEETVQPAYENADAESDEPPKPEVTEVKEADAFYSKKCKLFYKKESEFKEKGVGTLHLKHTPEGKTQLIVRADTNLGNILLNIILQASMPCSRMGKNNVLLVCIPNPSVDDRNPTSPLPLLIRVKTIPDADELHKLLEEKKVL